MKRLMNTFIFTLVLVLFGATAIAQTSDYQVKERFEKAYAELKADVQTANTSEVLDSLKSEIDNLQYTYEPKEEILNKALYPSTFEGSVEELRELANSAKSKVMIIENQHEKLAALSDELASYKSEITRLNSRSDSLLVAIQNSEQSEKELSNLVQRYRQSIEERDEYMLNMIDSLFITYKDVQSQEFKELTEQQQRILQESDNPLKVLQSAIDDNIAVLKSGSQSLQTEDYLRMYVVQNRFEEVWNQIGSDLVALYGGDNKSQWRANIEGGLNDWHASASKNMWASIDQFLEENNIDLSAFDNNQSFYQAIEAFVTEATNASRDKVLTEENYESFQAFYDIWNGKIKSEWGQFVQEGQVLTMSQISTIDSEIMSWKEQAQPKPFLIPILFGISLIIIVGLIIVIARR